MATTRITVVIDVEHSEGDIEHVRDALVADVQRYGNIARLLLEDVTGAATVRVQVLERGAWRTVRKITNPRIDQLDLQREVELALEEFVAYYKGEPVIVRAVGRYGDRELSIESFQLYGRC